MESDVPATEALEAETIQNIPTKLNSTQGHEQDKKETDPAERGSDRAILSRPPLAKGHLVLLYLSLSLAILLALMDLTIVATALYTIALDFGSLANSYWVILAYSLTELGFTVIVTHLSDFLGRRTTLLTAFILFLAFSLAAGFSKNLSQLIIFRTFQGVGASGLYTLSILIMVEISPPKVLPFVGGIIGGVVACSGVLGPVVGGLLTRYVSWRWIFWIVAPISFASMCMFLLGLPKNFYASKERHTSIKSFDAIGSLLILAASILVVFGLQQGGAGAFAWNSSVVIASLAVGCICWVLLFGWEYYLRSRPAGDSSSVFPLSLLSRRTLAANTATTLLSSFTFFATIFLLPLRLQTVNHNSPSTAGLHMLPTLLAVAVASLFGGGISRTINSTFPTTVLGAALILLGAGLLSILSDSLSIPRALYPFQIVLGLGVGMIYSSGSVFVSTEVEPRRQSVAQGITSQARLLGGSIGVAMANGVTNSHAQAVLKGVLTPGQIQALRFGDAAQLLKSLSPAQREAVRIMYAGAFERTMRIAMGVAVVGFVVSWGVWDERWKARGRKKTNGNHEGED